MAIVVAVPMLAEAAETVTVPDAVSVPVKLLLPVNVWVPARIANSLEVFGRLNQHWFLTLADAAEKLEAWRRYYNEERPHGAIGNNVPIMLTKSGSATSPSP